MGRMGRRHHKKKVEKPTGVDVTSPGFIAGMVVLALVILTILLVIILWVLGVFGGAAGTILPTTADPTYIPRPAIFFYMTEAYLSSVGGFDGIKAKCEADFPTDFNTGPYAHVTPIILNPDNSDFDTLIPAEFHALPIYGSKAILVKNSWNNLVLDQQTDNTWGDAIKFRSITEGSINGTLAWSNITSTLTMSVSSMSCEYYDSAITTVPATEINSSRTLVSTSKTFGGNPVACITGSPGSEPGLPFLCAAVLTG